jgi:hypothetical protein
MPKSPDLSQGNLSRFEKFPMIKINFAPNPAATYRNTAVKRLNLADRPLPFPKESLQAKQSQQACQMARFACTIRL